MSKSIQKKLEREQERMAKKHYRPKESPLRYLTYDWVFGSWFEKLILVGFMILGMWKLLEVVF